MAKMKTLNGYEVVDSESRDRIDILSHNISEHKIDTDSHVTSAEKKKWNNKSNFSGKYSDLTGKPSIPTKTSNLSNDSGFIDKDVNNLTNYYLKTEVYDKEEVDVAVERLSSETANLRQSKADAIICEAEGTTIVATDSSDAGFEGLSLYGKSEQGSTTGAQLLDLDTFENGIINGNTGKITSSSWWKCHDYCECKPGMDYCISQSTDAYFQYTIGFYDGNKDFISIQAYSGGVGRSVSFTTPTDAAYMRISYSIKVSSGEVDRGNIMLNVGTEPLPWEPYTGNKPSPNPEYPQEVVSAGQKLVEGNQLFDKDAATLRHELYAVDGSTLANPDYYVSDYIEVVGGASYYLKKGTKAYGSSNCFYDANKNFLSTVSLTQGVLTVPSNAKYLRFNGVISEIDVTMLNAGTTALPYEPYTGGVKKTVDTGITMKLMGKNWLKNTAENQTADGVTFTIQEDDSVIVNGTAKADIYFMICGKKANVLVQAGVKYKVSGCPKGGSADTYRLQFNYINSAGVEEGKSDYGDGREYVTYADGILYTYIYIKNGTTVSNLTFKPMIRLASIEDDTYEPYKEQTITLQTPNGLPGIPLGTTIPDAIKNSPVHMSGVYWDDEEGQYYIADTVDAEKGVRVQRILYDNVCAGNVSISGDSNWYDSEKSYSYEIKYYKNGGNTFLSQVIGLCTHFESYTFNDFYYKSIESGIMNDQPYVVVNIPKELGICATVDEFKSWCMENDVKIAKVLATPIETPLSDEEILAYKALHTNKPTTTIMNSENVHMKVKYVADTKKYIQDMKAKHDADIEELKTAIIALGGTV